MSGLTGPEVAERIKANNEIIESEIQPAFFVLNEKIANAMKENEMLRAQCPHVYTADHVCKFCGTPEAKK